MYTSKFVIFSFVLTVSFLVKQGSAKAGNITLITKTQNYTCETKHITINKGELVEIHVVYDSHISFAWCMFNKHKEENPYFTTNNRHEMQFMIQAETYMSGKWVCTTFTNRADEKNLLLNNTHEDFMRRNKNIYMMKNTCALNITVIDQGEKIYIWIYIGLAFSFFILIIIAETVIIVYYRKKVRKPNRLEELSLNQYDETIEDKARYSVRPGLMSLLTKNKESKEVDTDTGSLYETLNAVSVETPPPPPIKTLPRKSKKSFLRKLSKTPVPKEEDLSKKESLGNENPASLERLKNRPPMPLPPEVTDTGEPATSMKRIKKKEDHEHLIKKESREPPAATRPIKKEDLESLVGKETRGKSGSVGKFSESFNHNSTNPDSTATKKPKNILSATNKTTMSELNMILQNRRDGTLPLKPKSKCPAKPEPKVPVDKQTASESKNVPKLTATAIVKPTVTRPGTLTKPDTASIQPLKPSQQVKQTLRTAQPATKPQPAPAMTQSSSPQPVSQTSSLRPGKMKPQPTPDVPRKPVKPPMALPPDVVAQTEPPTPRPIAVKPVQCSEEPAYEEYDDNSDEEWTYETLDKYNIYSN